MKHTFIYILFGLSLLLAPACQTYQGIDKPSDNIVSKMKGVLYTSVTGGEAVLKILPGKSKNAETHVCIWQDAISDVTLKISLMAAPDAVDVYNATHPDAPALLLPASAYTFVNNDLMLARYNTSSTAGKIKITAGSLEDDQLYILPLTVGKVEGTDNWELAENAVSYLLVMQTQVGPEGGDGTLEFPYELRTVEDLKAMKDLLLADEKVYFKLMNDIDMASVDDWVPLNWEGSDGTYNYGIDFDGGGHTIDNFHLTDWPTYASFFGVLNGYCHDVSFTNAVIEAAGASGCGILGGYGGTGNKHADVARVHVQGKVTFKGDKTGIGGMFGCAGNATIEGCSADVEVWSGKNYVGGLFGYSKKATVSNCWVSGSVRGDQRVGGIAGGINGDGDAIINSYCIARVYTDVASMPADESGGLQVDQKVNDVKIVLHWATEEDGLKAGDAVFTDAARTVPAGNGDYTRSGKTITVSGGVVTQLREYAATRSVGGIVGHANQDKGDTPGSRTPGNVVSGCLVWMDAIKPRTYQGNQPVSKKDYDNDWYTSGVIVGFGASHNTYQNCYYNADLIFRDYSDVFQLYNQENSTPNSPLAYQEVAGSNYNYPYHGKSAPAGATLSSMAQSLGWDPAIWDFGGDRPLIKASAPVGPIPEVTGNGQLPGFENNDL